MRGIELFFAFEDKSSFGALGFYFVKLNDHLAGRFPQKWREPNFRPE